MSTVVSVKRLWPLVALGSSYDGCITSDAEFITSVTVVIVGLAMFAMFHLQFTSRTLNPQPQTLLNPKTLNP